MSRDASQMHTAFASREVSDGKRRLDSNFRFRNACVTAD
jgi:hypothetical protein